MDRFTVIRGGLVHEVVDVSVSINAGALSGYKRVALCRSLVGARRTAAKFNRLPKAEADALPNRGPEGRPS